MKHLWICVCIAAAVFSAACSYDTAEEAPQQGEGNRTFYVSASAGNDNNDGLSESNPIKTLSKVNSILLGPNDKVLFQSGDVWFCADEAPPTALVPKGRGNDGLPIIIGAYGSGNRPLIAGSGLTEAVRIEKTEYIRVQGLEITNDDERAYLGNPAVTGPQIRRGVYLMVENMDYNKDGDYPRRENNKTSPAYGAMRGVELVDLDIHDVFGYAMHANDFGWLNQGGYGKDANGQDIGRWWMCGGIFIKNADLDGNGKTGSRANMGLPLGRIVDPIIKDCYIHDLTATAIYADHSAGTWDYMTGDDGMDYIFTGCKVEGTVISHTGSEGIALTNAFWNFTINHCGIYDLGYLADRAGGWFMGAIYTGNNAVTQNTEIARMIWTGDSHAWDNDIGCYAVSLIQYNYVRDMTGSFFMNWGGWYAGEAATLLRYNISVNNTYWSGEANPYNNADGNATLILNTNSNTYFYNNVFYNDKQRPIRIRSGGSDHAAFVNNVFWSNGSTVLDLSNWKNNQADMEEGRVVPAYFENNLYYKEGGAGNRADIVTPQTDYPSRVNASFTDSAMKIGNPGFGTAGNITPGGAGDNENRSTAGYRMQIFGTPRRDIHEIASFFQITSASPLYKQGRKVTKKEVDDYLWGRTGAGVNTAIPRTAPHNSILQRGNPNIFNVNVGEDYFGNPLPDPEDSGAENPSIGVHNLP
jgi:hypothetical protein